MISGALGGPILIMNVIMGLGYWWPLVPSIKNRVLVKFRSSEVHLLPNKSWEHNTAIFTTCSTCH